MILLRRRRLFSSLAAAAAAAPATAPSRQRITPLTFSDTWFPASISHISPATSDRTLYHLTLDLSSYPSLPSQHALPGQFLPLRLPCCRSSAPPLPLLLSIASPPHVAKLETEFQLLVKRVRGSVSDVVCGMREGDEVEVGEVLGKGFEMNKLWSWNAGEEEDDDTSSILMFATGSGISPIRSLIESGFNENKNTEVRLYYGARNLERMAYQDRFKYWESCGVKVTPVLSRPDDGWCGARGYVQTVFSREKKILRPPTGAILCGHRQMTEEITSILLANGVPKVKILTNF